MTVGGAFLGGSAGNDIPVGQCEIIVQILTDNRAGMAKTVTIANSSHSYSVTTGADGNGSVLVATDGGNYTVTIQGISGYLNASPQIVTPLSTEAVLVRFDLIRVSSVALAMYPVGSLYISANTTNPSTFLGGTWEMYSKGRTLIGRAPEDADYSAVGNTGGSKTRTLTKEQLPSHSHSIGNGGSHTHNGTTGGGGNHYHRFNGHTVAVSYFGGGGQHPYEEGDGTNTSEAGNHTHNFDTNESGSHNHSCGNTGSGQPVDVREPYIVVSIWRRTA